jgi:HSP20 family protein
MDDFFNSFLGGAFLPIDGECEVMRVWGLEVEDKDNEIVVKTDIPGFQAKEIDVQVKNSCLAIKAEKHQKKDGEESCRTYRRTITLPCGIKEEMATAICCNGVLELHLPKTEGNKAKTIPVQTK